MLDVKQATKVFSAGTASEHHALNGLDLHLDEGEFVTIIGSNGAGKSTLFNAICGNYWLDQGQIFLDGQDITFLSEHRRARQIGRVFQDPMKGTAPHLTIEENLALAYTRKDRKPFRSAVRKQEKDLFRTDGSGKPYEDEGRASVRWSETGCDASHVYACHAKAPSSG